MASETGYVVTDGTIRELRGKQAEIEQIVREELSGATIYWDRAMAENTLAYGDDVTARQVEAREMLTQSGMAESDVNRWHFGTPVVPNVELGRAMDKLNKHKTPPWLEVE